MADQADFPDIYIDSSVAGGGVGSEADPYSAFSEINWTTGGDNSITDYYAGSPAASVTINLQKGELWREALTIGSSGTAAYRLTTQAYGAGDAPIINGSDVIETWSEEAGIVADLFDNDFETEDLSQFTGAVTTGGAAAAAEAAKFADTWGGRLTFDNSSAELHVYETISDTNSVYLRFFFRLSSGYTQGTGYFHIAGVSDGANAPHATFTLYQDAGGDWTFRGMLRYGSYSSATVSGGVITPHTNWMRGELYYNNGAGEGNDTIEARLYDAAGSLIGSGSTTMASTDKTQTRVFFGGRAYNAIPANADYIDYDECAADATEWIGYGSIYPDVWKATVTTEPTQVFFDGTRGTLVDSLANLDAANEWYWAANTLYVYSSGGDPDTEYTTPGIEATQRRCITASGKDYITFDGLNVKRSNEQYVGAFRMVDSCSYVTIQNCTADESMMGIDLNSADYSVVDNCTASNNLSHGIDVHGATTGTEVKNCTVHGTVQTSFSAGQEDGYGIKFLTEVTGSSIHNCKSYDNDFNGIDLDISCTDNDIYENEVYANGDDGLLVEIGSSGNRIYRNRVYDNGEVEVRVWQSAINNEVYDNVIYKTEDTGGDLWLLWVGGSGVGKGSTGTKIYNNTLYGSNVCTRGIFIGGEDSPENTLIKNNIIADMNGECLYFNADSYTGLVCDYNLMERNDSANIVAYDLSPYTLATWRSSLSQGANSIEDDPGMTDPSSDDYTLAVGSPCIDTGIDLGSSYDDALLSTSSWPDSVVVVSQGAYGAGWEIGAYVYDSEEYNLAIADAALALASENLALTQAQVIAIQNAALALSSDNIDIIEGSTISGNKICRLLHLIMRG